MERPWFLNQNSHRPQTPRMEPWTDGAPLMFNQNSHKPRTPRVEPWTHGAPLILKSELLQTSNSEDGALDDGAPDSLNLNSYRPWTPRVVSRIDGAPLLSKSELLQTWPRGRSLGLIARPWWFSGFDGLSGFVNDVELQEEGSDGRPCGFSRLVGSCGFGGFTGFSGFYGSGRLILRALRV